MYNQNALINDYYFWLLSKVIIDSHYMHSYSKLYSMLFDVTFTPTLHLDYNRVKDGIDLRASYPVNDLYHALKDKPCSILELMVALADRIEHDVMYDGETNKTHIWFEKMIDSLGLSEQTDNNFNEEYVMSVLQIFNAHAYRSDGLGGLVYIPNFDGDIRELDIWAQMNIYANIYDMTEQ